MKKIESENVAVGELCRFSSEFTKFWGDMQMERFAVGKDFGKS